MEYTNTSLVREKIQRGIITTTTTTESVSYSVQSVFHPVTGELISVLQAVEEGIIDPTNGRYSKLVFIWLRQFYRAFKSPEIMTREQFINQTSDVTASFVIF